MNIEPETLSQKERYKIVTGTVLPRPIAWVSSMDAEGRLNLAPFSYFTIAATAPLTLLFCPQVRADGGEKDTLRNIEATGEFVINLTNEDTAEAMNLTATELAYGESEFSWAGLSPAPSSRVAVPRVAEAPAAFECVLQQVVRAGSGGPGSGAVVFGEVQSIFLRDDLLDENGYVRLEVLRPIGRLAGASYTRVRDIFHMVRVAPPVNRRR
ncbi:MAG: flavin reductase family protein [Anaerolineae bacterium]|nr:flavin reductase family protein [Anaerolineae bacterium]